MTADRKRTVCMLVAVLLALSLLLSVSFIILHTDHDCAGIDCAVCALLHVCRNTVRALFTLLAVTAAIFVCTCVLRYGIRTVFDRIALRTLIGLKVKLSD